MTELSKKMEALVARLPAEIRNPEYDPMKVADAYRDSIPDDDADEIKMLRGEVAWLREAIRRRDEVQPEPAR